MTTTNNRLSPAQIEQYNRDGYTLFQHNVFPEDKFARLQAIFEEDLERYGEEKLDTIHFRDARLLEFLLSDEILDLIEPLVGPDIGLWSSHFISKPPFKGKATPWHEDSSYWEGRISTMEGIVTVWLALDRSTKENGCMAVIPGSQKNGFSQYEAVDSSKNLFGSQIKAGQFDPSQAVYFELEPNQCSLHEARIIHGAEANTSPLRRAGYTMRYFPLTTQILPGNPANQSHKLWIARGTDRAGSSFEN